MTYEFIEIIKYGEIYRIYNVIYERFVGEIRKERMGRWLHWQLFQYPNCGFTNGCLKELSKFITALYRKDRDSKKVLHMP